jgi:hypothetical protein
MQVLGDLPNDGIVLDKIVLDKIVLDKIVLDQAPRFSHQDMCISRIGLARVGFFTRRLARA